MAAVPQKTLNWLYDVLKREYRDPNRTYSDLAQTLTQYPTLAPRTDVYTSENGAPALLLNLKGTLPVNFRGTTYQFPIALWVPHAYPYEAPIAYVTPTGDMMVRPGQHVSVSDGKIYHHYLARWREAWDRSSVIELLKILADIFAREPPVMAKPQQTIPSQSRQPGPPPIPASPQDQRRYSSQPPLPAPPGRTGFTGQNGPPQPPPKHTSQSSHTGSAGPPSPSPRPNRYDAPPPLPQETSRPRQNPPTQPGYGDAMPQPSRPASQYLPQRTSSLRQEYPPRDQPSLPHQQYQQQPPERQQSMPYSREVSSPQPQPGDYNRMYSAPPVHPIAQPQAHHQVQQPLQPQASGQRQQQPQQYIQQPQTQYPNPPQQAQYPYQQAPPQAQPQPRPLPPNGGILQPQPAQQKDLLSEDDPFQIALPTSKSQVPAPPIPTNPEKTAILSALSHIIIQHLHTQVQQTQASALPSLASQHAALTTTSQTLNNELHQLQSLSSQLQSNISALQTTLKTANTTISATQDPKSQSHPDNIPAIDQIIIPPTVVARQLYDTVAEQRGYEAAIFALNEAFVRGRIGAEIWDRKVRQCAREEMRRKWLVRKIGNGLGLEET